MNTKLIRHTFYIVSTLLITISLLLSCNIDGNIDSGSVKSREVSYISVNQNQYSKGFVVTNSPMYTTDNLYWYFTAKWSSSNLTSADSDTIGVTEVQQAIKTSGETGLSNIGPFSLGIWDITIYGYASKSDLTSPVYFGTKTDVVVKKGEITGVDFQLEKGTAFPQKGKLVFEKNMTLTVPEGQSIDAGNTLLVEVYTDSVRRIATSTTSPKTTVGSGSVITLNDFEFQDTTNLYDAGTKTFEFKVYKTVLKNKTLLGTITHIFTFKEGMVTTVGNNLNDLAQ